MGKCKHVCLVPQSMKGKNRNKTNHATHTQNFPLLLTSTALLSDITVTYFQNI